MRFAPSNPEREQGFTLVEVLVAFAIAALLLVPLMRIFSGGIRNLAQSDHAVAATLWAQTELAARDGEAPMTIGAEGGDLPGGYHWQRTVTLYRDASLSPGLAPLIPYDVTMIVSWRERGRSRAVTLETLRLAPPPRYRVP